MKTFLHTAKRVFGASLLVVFALGFANAQDAAPAPDTTRNTSAADTVGTANGNNTPVDQTSTQGTHQTGRSIINDRGNTSIGQYDPSGNSLPVERSPYEYIGAPSYKVDRKPKPKPTQPQYRDYGGTVFRQPDPSGNGTPATPMPKEDPYASNQPAAPNTAVGNTATPADTTNTQSGWDDAGEARPANATGARKGAAKPAPKTTAPADTTKQQRIKGWDY